MTSSLVDLIVLNIIITVENLYLNHYSYSRMIETSSSYIEVTPPYTMPCTLKLTSFVFADQCSLLKQYVYRPSIGASKE